MAKKVWTSLDFGGNAGIDNASHLSALPDSDQSSLIIQGYSTSQSSDVIQVKDGSGNSIWKVTGNSIIEIYKDSKSLANHVHQNHTTRIVSGHYIRPLLSSAILSGNLDANSTRITSLSNGTSSSDAVNVGQLNTTASGIMNSHVALSNPHAQYVLNNPSLDNVIQAADDIIPLIIAGVDGGGQSVNLLEFYDFVGNSLVLAVDPGGSISSQGGVSAAAGFFTTGAQSNLYGINNQRQTIINVAPATTASGVVILQQMNSAVSGLLDAGSMRALYQVFDLPAISGTTETDLINYNIASGTLGTDDGIRINLRGHFMSNVGGAGNNVELRVYWGSGLYIGEYVWLPASGIARAFECDFVIQNMNSRTKQLIHGKLQYDNTPSYGAFSGIAQFGGWGMTGGMMMNNVNTSYPNKDTAVAQNLRVTSKVGSANSQLYTKLDYAEVRYMRGTT